MTDKREHKRKPPISYRPPEALRAEFERRVQESGLSSNAFLTEGWHGRNRYRPAEQKILAQILARCAEFADQQRQTARNASSAESDPQSDELKTLLIEIRSALFSLMGRKP